MISTKATQIALIGRGWLSQHFEAHLRNIGYHHIYSFSRTQKIQFHLGMDLQAPMELQESDYIFIFLPSTTPNYLNSLSTLKDLISPNKKVILISTTGIYCDNTGPIDESTQLPLQSERSQKLKKAEDIIIESFQHSYIIRSAGQIGANRAPIRSLLKSKRVINGNEKVNIIHQEDLCQIMALTLTERDFPQVINAVSPYHPLKKDFYSQQAATLGLDKPTFENGPFLTKEINSRHLDQVLFKNKHCLI